METYKKAKYCSAAIWVLGFFLLWELVALLLDKGLQDPMAYKKLPYFHQVILEFGNYGSNLVTQAGITLSRAGQGFFWGALAGIVLAVLMDLSGILKKVLMPYVLASQMIPILGLAPVVFGLVKDIDLSRVVIAAYMTFFPVTISMMRGMSAIDPDSRALLSLCAANKIQEYGKLIFPASLPHLFTGLKLAAPMSVTASVLVDTLSAKDGIGYVLVLPILFGAIMIVLLQSKVIHAIFGLKELQLPLPSQVVEAFFQRLSDICTDMGITLLPAVLGLILGGLIGYGTALLAVRFPRGGYGSLILMTAINSIPVVALATVMNRWFDSALSAKTAVAVVLTMGIMTVNAFKGLCDLRPFALDLMRSYGAETRTVFWKLRLPASLPDVFTALKLGSTTAMMATIISEFFASETAGVGFMIKYSLRVGNQKAVGWAYIVAATILSLALYGAVCLLERHFLRWHVSIRKK